MRGSDFNAQPGNASASLAQLLELTRIGAAAVALLKPMKAISVYVPLCLEHRDVLPARGLLYARQSLCVSAAAEVATQRKALNRRAACVGCL